MGKNNPVIGSVECPNCGADTPVKENKNGNGYFFCPCGVHMRFNQSLTHSMFILPGKMSELGEQNIAKTESESGTAGSEAGEQFTLQRGSAKPAEREPAGAGSFFD